MLLAEDEPRVAGFIAKGLREQSYAVDLARDSHRHPILMLTARDAIDDQVTGPPGHDRGPEPAQ